MRKILLSLFILLAGCSVYPHKPVSYKGKEDAIKPYVQLDGMFKTIFDCDPSVNTCQVQVAVLPWIHNPLNFEIEGQLTCSFERDDYESTPVHSDLLKLEPKQSMMVRVTKQLTVPGNARSNITVGCSFRYRQKNGYEHRYFTQQLLLKNVVDPRKQMAKACGVR